MLPNTKWVAARSSWHFAPLILDIRLDLANFYSWSAMKVSRSVNLWAHI
jgi:hypothetical protein